MTVAPDLRESEAGFMAVIRDYARLNGWRTYHTGRSDGSDPGWPDLALCRPPRFVVAEVKSSWGRLTVDQQGWLADLRRSGVAAYLWRPADWPTILQVLAR
jgi:hypothetical protein